MELKPHNYCEVIFPRGVLIVPYGIGLRKMYIYKIGLIELNRMNFFSLLAYSLIIFWEMFLLILFPFY